MRFRAFAHCLPCSRKRWGFLYLSGISISRVGEWESKGVFWWYLFVVSFPRVLMKRPCWHKIKYSRFHVVVHRRRNQYFKGFWSYELQVLYVSYLDPIWLPDGVTYLPACIWGQTPWRIYFTSLQLLPLVMLFSRLLWAVFPEILSCQADLFFKH